MSHFTVFLIENKSKGNHKKNLVTRFRVSLNLRFTKMNQKNESMPNSTLSFFSINPFMNDSCYMTSFSAYFCFCFAPRSIAFTNSCESNLANASSAPT